jgi:CDGSH-type Zn-finger protein
MEQKRNSGYVYAPIPLKGDIMMNKPTYKEKVFPKCKCGKSKEKHGLCDGTHETLKTNETK